MSPDPSPSLPQLFISFLRLGLTAFGGPSMVAHIRKVTVEQKRWPDAVTFNAGVALCQMLPGATAMQVAACVGLRTRGIWGAAVSFIGFGLPAFQLMTLLAALYTSTHNLPIVLAVFSGLQAIVVATLSIFLPSFVVPVATAPHFDRLRASPVFNKIIVGVLCSFVGLLVTVTLRFAGSIQWNLPLALLAGAALTALLLKVDILWVVAAGIVPSVFSFR